MPTPPGPVKPARLTIRVVESGERLAFTHRQRQWGTGCFLLLWLTGWTVGCVFLVGVVAKDPKIQNLLFAVPFWASWIFVFCLVLTMFLQSERFAIDESGVSFVRRVIVPIRTRLVPLDEIQRFKNCSKVTDSESGRTKAGIEMQTIGQPLCFAWGLPEQERDWLKYQLNQCLAALRGAALPEAQAAPKEEVPESADAEQSALETLTPAKTPLEPPSDSRWRRAEDFRDVIFVQHGRFSLSALGVLLFINAFWNGIVSVFVGVLCFGDANGKPAGGEWWGLFVFLIPFEVIGLVMFLALLAALIEPLRRTQWRFTDSMIERRTKWLGIGPKQRHWVDGLSRIELRAAGGGKRRRGISLQNIAATGEDSPNMELSFVGKANIEICAMTGLTEGEARWISDTIRRERAAWFRQA